MPQDLRKPEQGGEDSVEESSVSTISSIGSIRAGLWHAKEKPYYSCPTPPTDVVRASCLDETTMAWGHVIESRKM